MSDPLQKYLRDLHSAALAVSDEMTNRVDHYTFEGSMNLIEDLQELLERAQVEPAISAIVYGADET